MMTTKQHCIVPGVCRQCGFAIEPRKKVCGDCKKQNRRDKALTDRYEAGNPNHGGRR